MGFVLGESRGRKPCVFPCKAAPAGDERYLVCAAGAAAVEPGANRFLLCVLQWVVVHVCVVLCVFWLSGCRSEVAKRNVMAASRLLGATPACIILLSFAAGHCKLYWNGCFKSARVICQLIFSILALMVFPLKLFLKSGSKSCLFFPLASRAGFGAAISNAVARISIVFYNSVSADLIVMAASRLLGATAACVILLSFAAGHCKLYWNGCIKSARVICQLIFSILALMIFPLKLLLKSASKSCFVSFGVEIRFWSCNFQRCCAYLAALRLRWCFKTFFGSCVQILLWSFNFGALGGAVRKLCSTKVCKLCSTK